MTAIAVLQATAWADSFRSRPSAVRDQQGVDAAGHRGQQQIRPGRSIRAEGEEQEQARRAPARRSAIGDRHRRPEAASRASGSPPQPPRPRSRRPRRSRSAAGPPPPRARRQRARPGQASGTIRAAIAAYSGGFRVKNATTRSRGPSPASSPKAAPTEKPPSSSAACADEDVVGHGLPQSVEAQQRGAQRIAEVAGVRDQHAGDQRAQRGPREVHRPVPPDQARAEAVIRATYPSRIPIADVPSSSSRAMLKKTTIGTSV